MAVDLIDVNITYSDHYPGLLDIPEMMVDECPETPHGGGEVHIGIDQRRDIFSQLAYFL